MLLWDQFSSGFDYGRRLPVTVRRDGGKDGHRIDRVVALFVAIGKGTTDAGSSDWLFHLSWIHHPIHGPRRYEPRDGLVLRFGHRPVVPLLGMGHRFKANVYQGGAPNLVSRYTMLDGCWSLGIV